MVESSPSSVRVGTAADPNTILNIVAKSWLSGAAAIPEDVFHTVTEFSLFLQGLASPSSGLTLQIRGRWSRDLVMLMSAVLSCWCCGDDVVPPRSPLGRAVLRPRQQGFGPMWSIPVKPLSSVATLFFLYLWNRRCLPLDRGGLSECLSTYFLRPALGYVGWGTGAFRPAGRGIWVPSLDESALAIIFFITRGATGARRPTLL